MELTYPPGIVVRRVSAGGGIKIRAIPIQVSESLAGYTVGLESLDAVRYAVWFGGLCLGEVNLALRSFQSGA